MTEKLPLKAKLGIREHWTKQDSSVQQALRGLQELLGHELVIDPEWPLLVAALDSLYEDKTNLVAVVAGCVQVWAKSMTELLDDSANEAWTEKVLEKVSGRLRAFVEVSSSDQGSTSWSEERGGFVISLPKKMLVQPAELFPAFRGGLLACFDVPKQPQPLADRDWEGVEVVDGATGEAEVVIREGPPSSSSSSKPAPTTRSKVEFLPNAASLPRPDELLLRPPYHLTLSHTGDGIELQCSHSPTLKLLAEYLKKWCRTNHNDTRNPPAVNIQLHQCAFGLGELFDRMTMKTGDGRYGYGSSNPFTMTVPMIVSIVEGVLGYDLISTEGTWKFRRDTEFRTL
ncbi:hypothetical protein VTJ83DRAFT_769 [Remersonia thermophila]|uniref:Uncharacterized protein n=1 Tax=Remersonia thermophila TaxID=72144 RepID=A0ABR4DM96_9PEZI